MPTPGWHDVGAEADLRAAPLREVRVGNRRFALSCANGIFGAVHGSCSHAGGPLATGALDGEYVVCPWHHWKYHRLTGLGEPGYEGDAIPRYNVRVVNGRVEIDLASGTSRTRLPHAPHPLSRPVVRAPGPVRVLGISTTHMERGYPRFSTSEALLEHALSFGAQQLSVETKMLRLRDLAVQTCEGYYSKSAKACTWPCSITQRDPSDEMEKVYEGLVHWADVVLLATPIRWGNASSHYYRMAERLNCVQNQVTIANRLLIRNKVAAFIILGGQDNVQGVAGQLLSFFGELGFRFPQLPFIAHSRGWSAEDMEENVRVVQESRELRQGAEQLMARAVDSALLLLDHEAAPHLASRGGRKAHTLSSDAG